MIVGLFILYLGDLFFISSLIFIAIDHVNSSKETHLSFVHFLECLLLFLDGKAGFVFATRDSYFTIQVEVFTNHILAKKDIFHE